MKFITRKNRATNGLTKPLEELVSPDSAVRRMDFFVDNLDLAALGFDDLFCALLPNVFCNL